MKRKLKIMSVFALVLAITISFASSCFASETENVNSKTIDIYYNNKVYTIDYSYLSGSADYVGNYNKYVVLEMNSDGYIYYLALLTFDDEIIVTEASDGKLGIPGGLKYVQLTYDEDVDNFSSGSALKNYESSIVYRDVKATILSSNYDVKNSDGNVVFQVPPAVAQTTLAPIIQEAPLEETTGEIVKIIPIVLIILVGLIGLRKGLALLSQTLHKA